MITTIDDDTNGFRLNLIPMALSSSDMSSRSLLEATLALASFHIGREEDALKHKVQAIKLLSDSFRSTTEQNRIAQFSTCMMLCVYSVFDSSDTTWNLHLQGAKSVIEAFSRLDRSDPSMAFMVHWLKYHDVFSVYSHRAEPSYTATDKNPELIMTLPESTAYNQQIIGLLGCSPELLGLISNINQLRTWLQTTNPPSARGAALPHLLRIRKRLLHLKQEILVRPGETSGAISHTRITLTAELYRIAALLYLFQVFALLPSTHTQIATLSSATTSQAHPSTLSSSPPSTSSSSAVWWNTSLVGSEDIANIVRQGLAVLDQLEICTSPWPLFIVACNVSDDADRIKMVGIIEAGGRARRVGNYQVVGSLVQAVWKRQDLAANERGEKGGLVVVDWRDLIEEGEMMPSFI
ncbi:unnamed protein product [Periconia digitata]|uniref:Uncharacterized protein n=1 Tax=Periconia digitata TaxID=1303443 RepID=A0A9W4UBZ1_9PLEO|nr:unnamed protein product [Periconia digitata]